MQNDIINSQSSKPSSNQVPQPTWYLDLELNSSLSVPKPQEGASASPSSLTTPSTPQQAPALDPDFADLDASATPASTEPTLGAELHSRVQNVLSQPMDRKRFLQTTGLAVLGVVGLGQLVKLLGPGSQQHVAQIASSGPAYGGGNYGGTKSTLTNSNH
jgi:hypothetical protein